MKRQQKETARLIGDYCARMGITREQYDLEGTLLQENIDALVELRNSPDADPVMPLGLPGAGKRRSELTLSETEQLAYLESELDDLLSEPVDG